MTTRPQFISSKERRRRYKTIEFYNPTIGVLRYVDGRVDPINFTLESTAPRNAGESVTYEGGSIRYQLPEQNSDNASLEIQLGRVGKMIKQKLKLLTGFARFDPTEVIIREFIDGATDGPFVLPMNVSTITMTAEGVAILAELDNPASRNVSEIYTIERFPGLGEVF